MIDHRCPKCGAELSSPDSLAGQEETCRECDNVTRVPQQASEMPSRVPPSTSPARPAYQHSSGPPLEANVNVRLKGLKSVNALGIAALVLGMLAAIICWIPFVGMLGVPLGVLGLLFAIIGFLIALIGGKSGIGFPVSGAVVCVVTIIVAVSSTIGPPVGLAIATKKSLRGSAERRSSFSSASRPAEAKEDADKEAYLDKVLLKNVRVGKSVLDRAGVFGEVKNTGNRALKEVEIVIYCLDAKGHPVFEKTFHPVLVSDWAWSVSDGKLLKPNYSQTFGYSLDDAPSEWSKKVHVQVVSVEFAD